jgi:hypothetical protein
MSSNETLIAEVRQSRRPELFDQGLQTDQLMVLQGSIDLIMLLISWFRRITLRADDPVWVLIPPGGLHGVLRHRPRDPRDDAPLRTRQSWLPTGASQAKPPRSSLATPERCIQGTLPYPVFTRRSL